VAVFLVIGLVLYWPAITGGFIWDDNPLLVENPLVHADDGLYRLWFTMQAIDYWPLTASVYWVGWRLWGSDPTGYHALNIVLHVVSAVLLWRLGRRLAIPGAMFAALLFLVHPLQVESVAWIAQLKNTLSMALALLAVLIFARHEGWNGAVNGRVAAPSGVWYPLSVMTFALAMLAKGSVATVPGILLVIIWWQRGHLTKQDLVRIAPFVAIAIGLTIVTMIFQAKGDSPTFARDITPVARVLGASGTVWFYLYKSVLPLGLMFVYPLWRVSADNPMLWASFVGASTVTAVAWRYRHTDTGRPLFVAWAVFLFATVPVMGLRDVYFMRYSAVADHYAYLPLIAVVCLAAAAGARLHAAIERSDLSGATRRLRHQALAAIGTCLVLWLGILTWRQSHLYVDATTMYTETLRRNPNCLLCESNLAATLLARGTTNDVYRAIDHLHAAMRIDPSAPEPHEGLGIAYGKLGRLQEAVDAHARALALDPNFAVARANLQAARERLGAAHGAAGRLDAAAVQFERALDERPGNPVMLEKLAQVRLAQGRAEEAVKYFSQAVIAAPGFAEAHDGLASAWRTAGALDRALTAYQEAVRLAPANPYFRNNFGAALLIAGRADEAVAEFRQGLTHNPSSPLLHRNLALALAEQGRLDEAALELSEAIRLDPQFQDARDELEDVLRRQR